MSASDLKSSLTLINKKLLEYINITKEPYFLQ